QSVGGWMIPPESMGHLCLVISAVDELAVCHVGVVRITDAILSTGGNRDAKRSITAAGREKIHWLFKDFLLPPNILLQLPRAIVDQIMALPSGQQRIDQIFRVAQKKRIGRGVIATLGQQDDYMKRIRGNGGSRTRLKSEGIIILGHYEEHRRIAHSLGIPVPDKGETVSVRVVPADSDLVPAVRIDRARWRVANDDDPIVEAPNCPHR
ncbi:MAG: hypothetical protein JNM43_10570, partial [Planctomycetaceae bacterium]|nr:hypothetical protein [Planctomycetaceae bacterium]